MRRVELELTHFSNGTRVGEIAGTLSSLQQLWLSSRAMLGSTELATPTVVLLITIQIVLIYKRKENVEYQLMETIFIIQKSHREFQMRSYILEANYNLSLYPLNQLLYSLFIL